MVSPRVLAVVFFAISHPAAALTEPRIFFNLTREEFMLKRSEYTHGDPVLSKRALVDEENRNADPQVVALVETHSAQCVERFGEGMRITRGHCAKSAIFRKPRMEIFCNRPPRDPYDRYRHTTKACRKDDVCDHLKFINYYGQQGKLPFCKSTIAVNKRPGPEVQIPPVYNGWMTVPHEDIWSPGTWDSFYELADWHAVGLKASWEYRGHYANGWGFLRDSVGLSTSFACLGCPSGTLYVETVGFKSQATGFTISSIVP